jgi:hypothetical protein
MADHGAVWGFREEAQQLGHGGAGRCAGPLPRRSK